tara:strand:- start:732 stop:1007 length:276 start_codon:yes stop_codon:yes gene_type:complete
MNVTIYTIDNCKLCDHAKLIMKERGVDYDEIRIGIDIPKKEFKEKYSADKAPLVYYGNWRVGGASELWKAIYRTNLIPVKISAVDQLLKNK